jgi:hypothetical protein
LLLSATAGAGELPAPEAAEVPGSLVEDVLGLPPQPDADITNINKILRNTLIRFDIIQTLLIHFSLFWLIYAKLYLSAKTVPSDASGKLTARYIASPNLYAV